MNLSGGITKLWRGYHVLAFTADDNWSWEPDLALIEMWLEENTRCPPIQRIEIYDSCVVLSGHDKTHILERTKKGLRYKEL